MWIQSLAIKEESKRQFTDIVFALNQDEKQEEECTVYLDYFPQFGLCAYTRIRNDKQRYSHNKYSQRTCIVPKLMIALQRQIKLKSLLLKNLFFPSDSDLSKGVKQVF